MAIELLTPFSMVNRRTAIKGTNDVLTGRWVQLDNAGKVASAVNPLLGDSYLVIEGNILHTGSPSDFTNSGITSAVFTRLPSSDAVGALGIAYGIFRYHVGPEGVLQSDSAFATGVAVYLDSSGRLITTAGSAVRVGVVESVVGNQNAWTDITIRTVSQ